MAACDAVQAELSAYLDGELTADERTALAAHLRDCAACTAALAELEGVQGELKALPKLKAPATLAANIRREVAAAQGSTVSSEDVNVSTRGKIVPIPAPNRASMWGPGLVGVAALVMVGLLVFAVLPRISDNRGENTAMKTANEAQKSKKDVAAAAPKIEAKPQKDALEDDGALAAKALEEAPAAGEAAEKSADDEALGLKSEGGVPEGRDRLIGAPEMRKQLAVDGAPLKSEKKETQKGAPAPQQPGRPNDAMAYKKKSDENLYRGGALAEGEKANRGADPGKNADRIQAPAKAEAAKPFADTEGKSDALRKAGGGDLDPNHEKSRESGFGQGPGQGGQNNAMGGGGAPSTAATAPTAAVPGAPPAAAAMKELKEDGQQQSEQRKMDGKAAGNVPAERAAMAPKPGAANRSADKADAPSAKAAPVAEPPRVTGTPASPPEMSMAPSLNSIGAKVVYRTADPSGVARQVQKIAEASGAKFALLDESRRRQSGERAKSAEESAASAAENKAETAPPRVYKIVVAPEKRESVLKQLRSLQASLANAKAPARSVSRQPSAPEADAKPAELAEAQDLKAEKEEERNDSDNGAAINDAAIYVHIEPLTAKD